MLTILGALVPIFLLVLLGTAFRRYEFPAAGFWMAADRLTYYVFLPALLVAKLASAAFTVKDFYNLTGILCAAVILVGGLSLLLYRLLKFGAPTFTSVFQGSIRPNSYVALAAGTALFGAKGLALTAIIMAGVVPLVNVLSVAAFSYFVPSQRRGAPRFIRAVLTNPLVIACAVGIALNVSGIGLPLLVGDVLEILGAPALPLGLISVGYGLIIRGSRRRLLPTMVAVVLKLLVLPAIVWVLLNWASVDGVSLRVAMIFASVPCAISAYILAGQLKGDQETMATIITVETLVAFVTMPLILFLLG